MYIINTSEFEETYNIKIVETNSYVPLDPANSFYAEIMRQVDAGELTIEEAE